MAMLYLDFHIARSWIVLYNWNVSNALCSMRSREKPDSSWWLSHTYLATTKFMISILVLALFVHVACFLAFCSIHGWTKSFNEPSTTAICTSPWLWVVGVWGTLLILMAIAIYLSYQMRKVVDAFEIKTELMIAGGVWLVGAMPFWGITLLFPSLQHFRVFSIMLEQFSSVTPHS